VEKEAVALTADHNTIQQMFLVLAEQDKAVTILALHMDKMAQ
jgi:hypothetical protein